MKKVILTGALTLSIMSSALADCRSDYKAKGRSQALNDDLVGTVFGSSAAYGILVGVSNPVIFAIAVPLSVGAPIAINALRSAPYYQMVKLIDQAYGFRDSQYTQPERLLEKTYSRLNSSDMGLTEFADAIIAGNESKRLCKDIRDISDLKRDLADGKLNLVNVDIDESAHCRVVAQPTSRGMYNLETSRREDTLEHYAIENGLRLVASGVKPSELQKDSFDFAIVKRASAVERYRNILGHRKHERTFFFDILNNEGRTLDSVEIITTDEVRPRTFFGNFEGKAIKKVMSTISSLCRGR
jgi:hypothetical protein